MATAVDETHGSMDGDGPDRGYTLVECIMAIVLMGIIATTIMAALWTTVRVSNFSSQQADVEAVAGGAADALAATSFVPCPVNEYLYAAEAGAAAVGWHTNTVAISQIRYWDPYSSGWSNSNQLGGGECDPGEENWLSTARAMQKVTVTVTSPEGEYARSIDVIITDLRKKD